MSKFSWLALVALLGAFIFVGCTPTEEAEADAPDLSANADTDTDGDGEHMMDDGTTMEGDEHGDMDMGDGEMVDPSMTLALDAYVDDDGDAICPVLGLKVADISALESQVYDGKTYYFCCADCPDKFAADSASFLTD